MLLKSEPPHHVAEGYSKFWAGWWWWEYRKEQTKNWADLVNL